MGGPALLKTCVNYCGAFLVRDVFISIDYRPSDEMKVRSSADALGMRAGLEFVERFTGLGYTATAGRSSRGRESSSHSRTRLDTQASGDIGTEAMKPIA